MLSVYAVHSGPQNKRDITPDCYTMTGTLRSGKLEVMEQMEEGIQRIARGVATVNGASAKMTTAHSRAVINSPAAIKFCLQSAARILGEGHIKLDISPHLGGEGFSEYVAHIPRAYVYAGIATRKNRRTFGFRNSSFMLEESVVPGMTAVFAQFAVDFLERGRF